MIIIKAIQETLKENITNWRRKRLGRRIGMISPQELEDVIEELMDIIG